MAFAGKQMQLEMIIILTELSQPQKDKYVVFPLIYESWILYRYKKNHVLYDIDGSKTV